MLQNLLCIDVLRKKAHRQKCINIFNKKKEVKTEASSLEKEHTEDVSPKEEQVLDT